MSDGITAKVEGIERLRDKILKLGGARAKSTLQAANQKNADEFRATVERIIPKGDDEGGHLTQTLRTYSPGGVAVAVAIGDAGHPYPMHLEGGHRFPDGSIAPPKPFWNPAKRVQAKRAKSRARRAASQVVKSIAAGGAATPGE